MQRACVAPKANRKQACVATARSAWRTPDVYKARVAAHGGARQQRALDQLVRLVAQNLAVLAGACAVSVAAAAAAVCHTHALARTHACMQLAGLAGARMQPRLCAACRTRLALVRVDDHVAWPPLQRLLGPRGAAWSGRTRQPTSGTPAAPAETRRTGAVQDMHGMRATALVCVCCPNAAPVCTCRQRRPFHPPSPATPASPPVA